MNKPLVSICIPTRNRARTLRDTLHALRQQDYAHLDIVISDNCSEDDTLGVAREFMALDSRVRYFRHHSNIGLHRNHNFCFDAARGPYVCICHDHDERAPNLVSEYVAFLEQHPRVGVVCSDWNLIDDDGREIGLREHSVPAVTRGLDYIGRTIRSGRSSVGIPGAMARASAIVDARFVLDAPIGFGDFPVWFRVAETWDVGHIHQRLWSWRQNAESHSARTIQSIAHDFDANLNGYCTDHLRRWPAHETLVQQWRASIRHYLFWALAYELSLHFRAPAPPSDARATRSLFEIMNYRLTHEAFDSAVAQMASYRTTVAEYLVYACLITMIRLGLTHPIGWASRHQAALRTMLGLK